ncbi:MAG: S9 family peptidase [Planctomycetes bacterium]|nr:S9 family peptidase [Planctomycetota bacterium]
MSLLRFHACFLVLGLLVSSSALAQAAERSLTIDDLWKLQRVGPPSVSPDGLWCVVEVTGYNLETDEATSNLWLLSTDGKQQKQLTSVHGKNSGPKWSPDGTRIAFTSKRGTDEDAKLYVISVDGGEAQRAGKMPMAQGHLKWSGDSKTIYCIAWTWPDTPDDESHLKKEKALKEQKSKALVIDDAVYRYWDRFIADGKRPHVFAIDLETKKHRNLLAGTKLFLPPYEPSTHDYDVSPDGKELCFVADSVKEIGRDVNNDLYTLALDGKAVPVNITKDNTANDFNPVYSPDGKSIALLRQKIKFFYADTQRLAVYDREAKTIRGLTDELDRSAVNPKWLPDGKRLCFEADDAGYTNIYFVDLEKGEPVAYPEKVSERNMDLATKQRLSVFTRSSFDLPPTIFSHKAGEKLPRQISFFNDSIVSSWKLGKVESMTFKGADQEDVQMWIVYPPGFDAKKKWPLVQVVHGGPHNGIMSDFSFRWNPQLWAAQGWVIGIVNFHGSSGFGQKFADSITGDLGTKPMIDIVKATDWFEEQPWIDNQRIATAGASYGGYMMMWLNGHTDRFKAMVCHAGVYSYHSQMASDIVRGRERQLGAFPWGDLEKIDKQSAQRYAKNFQTPTLVLHGERDYRVPVTQGLEYYNTLKQKGIDSRLVYFPDENHWILKPGNSLVWHREVFAWLDKYIGKGPKK